MCDEKDEWSEECAFQKIKKELKVVVVEYCKYLSYGLLSGYYLVLQISRE